MLITLACGVLGQFDDLFGDGDEDEGNWLEGILNNKNGTDDNILGGELVIPDEVDPLKILEASVNFTKSETNKTESSFTETQIKVIEKVAVKAG